MYYASLVNAAFRIESIIDKNVILSYNYDSNDPSHEFPNCGALNFQKDGSDFGHITCPCTDSTFTHETVEDLQALSRHAQFSKDTKFTNKKL